MSSQTEKISRYFFWILWIFKTQIIFPLRQRGKKKRSNKRQCIANWIPSPADSCEIFTRKYGSCHLRHVNSLFSTLDSTGRASKRLIILKNMALEDSAFKLGEREVPQPIPIISNTQSYFPPILKCLLFLPHWSSLFSSRIKVSCCSDSWNLDIHFFFVHPNILNLMGLLKWINPFLVYCVN